MTNCSKVVVFQFLVLRGYVQRRKKSVSLYSLIDLNRPLSKRMPYRVESIQVQRLRSLSDLEILLHWGALILQVVVQTSKDLGLQKGTEQRKWFEFFFFFFLSCFKLIHRVKRVGTGWHRWMKAFCGCWLSVGVGGTELRPGVFTKERSARDLIFVSFSATVYFLLLWSIWSHQARHCFELNWSTPLDITWHRAARALETTCLFSKISAPLTSFLSSICSKSRSPACCVTALMWGCAKCFYDRHRARSWSARRCFGTGARAGLQ